MFCFKATISYCFAIEALSPEQGGICSIPGDTLPMFVNLSQNIMRIQVAKAWQLKAWNSRSPWPLCTPLRSLGSLSALQVVWDYGPWNSALLTARYWNPLGTLAVTVGAIPSDCRDDHSESCLTFTLSQFFLVSNLCSKNRGVLWNLPSSILWC